MFDDYSRKNLTNLKSNSDAGRIRDDNATDNTGAVIGIDIGHHEIHEGNHFYHKGFKSLGNGASYILLFKTGTNKGAHLNFHITSPKETTLSILEAVSVTLDGTSLSVLNNDRNSSNISEMTLFHTPTVSGGSEIFPASVGAGLPLGGGGNIRNECELLLKQTTNYKVTLTNSGATTAIIDYLFCWYEVLF